MLCRWIFDSGHILKQYRWFGALKYSTQSTAVESVLRSELRSPKETVTKLLERNRFLLHIKPDEIKKSVRRLRRLNFDANDIKTHPSVLLQGDFQLLNNYQRLHEVGFGDVTMYRLANIKKILTKSVHFNQSFNFLPKNINIVENIYTVAKVPFKTDDTKYDREMQLEAVHRMALRSYMLDRIEYTPTDIDEIWHYYPYLKTRSLQSIDESRQLIEDVYKVPIKQLPKFILAMQPEEIKELLATDTVSGIDVKYVMPLGAKCNLARIREIQIICSSYKVPDYAIAFSPKLFFMNVDTLKRRLDQICKLKQGTDFLLHVAIGKVILSMGRLKLYTNSQKLRFNSVFNDTFVNFFLNGFMCQKSNPPLFYLCNIFNKSKDEIKEALEIHPHPKGYSFPVIHQNIEFLLSQGFTLDDIFKDLPIILYSIDEIKESFDQLKDPIEIEKLNINPKQMKNSEILRLCIYLIERKCDFNGEGIFLNSHAIAFNDDESWQMEEIIKQIN